MGSGASATRAVAQIVLLDNQFSVMPSVVAEGRRSAGEHRTSVVAVPDQKSFYSAVLSLLVVFFTLTNLFEVEFVFLPRHLTVITWLTIGTPPSSSPDAQHRPVPARLLPKGVGVRGARGHHLRVLSFISYAVTLWQGHPVPTARVDAAITLFIIGWSALALIARPLTGLRLLIVVVMGLGFLAVLFIPGLNDFFALRLDRDAKTSIAIGLGILGAGLLVLVGRTIEVRLSPSLGAARSADGPMHLPHRHDAAAAQQQADAATDASAATGKAKATRL